MSVLTHTLRFVDRDMFVRYQGGGVGHAGSGTEDFHHEDQDDEGDETDPMTEEQSDNSDDDRHGGLTKAAAQLIADNDSESEDAITITSPGEEDASEDDSVDLSTGEVSDSGSDEMDF